MVTGPQLAHTRAVLAPAQTGADDTGMDHDDVVELATGQAGRLRGVTPAGVDRLTARGDLPYHLAHE